ncbi:MULTISPECIES: sensor histidine kinase [Thermoanaerobacterium]|uniref:histidine kinase n=2 Tax=Thermoanaerobacterium TaxID=28895 RepID=W9EAM6_9THEO|nr:MULTISPECIES: sensor histidine kinase [Thermoanaerobacterium]AFK85801.1 putative signal transduction histidine kinase [Thermoanaerobacterium saccharolyticum JW/SL-YS485]ETO37990.1 putative signal transduction histidine kinase [Thermoanaerobacterium aotearoense SCUT27]
MEMWIIATKLIIILYIIVKYIYTDVATYPAEFVAFILLYICINMAYYLTNGKMIKKLMLFLSIGLLMFSYNYVSGFFVFLFPLNIYEIFSGLTTYLFSLVASLSVMIFIKSELMPEYIITLLMSYLILFLSKMSYDKLESLKKRNDELRWKVQDLYIRIDKNEEYERQLKYTTQLEERNKLSQRIHDDIGHTISGSLMQLEASKLLMDRNKDDAKKMIQSTIDTLRNGLESIRIALREIKPPPEQMGLNRLKLVLDDFALKTHISANLKYTGIIDKITYSQWNIIMENVKELLTNAMKYSKATKVSLTIDVLNKFIKVEMKDNGVGTDVVRKGLGLKGIEERCESVGGKVIIDGSNGFSVIFLLPLEGC